jgi:2-dehydro-3-deoxygluconokinase
MADSAYVTRLDPGAFGRMFLDLSQHKGVDTRRVGIDADAHMGIYFGTHAAVGHEFSYLRAGSAASRMRPVDLPLELTCRETAS